MNAPSTALRSRCALTLPDGTVRFYEDGPNWPATETGQQAERAYRHAFLEAVKEVAAWDYPDETAIADAWSERRTARRDAEILVPSAELFGDPDMESEQVVYRVGHEVAASRTRGRCQALEMAGQFWFELCEAGATEDQIAAAIIPPWKEAVEHWATAEVDPQRIVPPPRPEDDLTEELQRMLESPRSVPLIAKTSHAITRRLYDVEREQLEWLWPGRIPLGKLTLLAGDPGLGKSFVTLDIAARVSRGDCWPDLPLVKQQPAEVVLFNAEDDLADTIAPRLDLAGANDRKIVAFEGVSTLGQRRHFSLEQDLPRLEEVLDENPATRLVVIDPISAYTGKVDSHKNADVRGLLAPLAELAGRRRLAIVAITHLSKTGGAKAIYRAMGSLAFAAASRAVWAITKDLDDPQRRLFLPAKLNLAHDPDGLAYRIVEGRVAWETEPVRLHADDAFAAEMKAPDRKPRGSERQDAMDWLCDELASSRKPSKEIIEYGRECGFSEKTIRRAYKEVGAKPTKESFDGPWLWGLPDEHAHEDDQDAH